MDNFPGQLVIGGSIMLAGGVVAYQTSGGGGRTDIATVGGILLVLTGLILAFSAAKGSEEGRKNKRVE